MVLVEPPMAMSRLMAFSNAARLAMFWEDTVIVLNVVASREFNNESPRLKEQRFTIGVSSQQRAVARQAQAERLSEAIH